MLYSQKFTKCIRNCTCFNPTFIRTNHDDIKLLAKQIIDSNTHTRNKRSNGAIDTSEARKTAEKILNYGQINLRSQINAQGLVAAPQKGSESSSPKKPAEKDDVPEVPTTCCMSGCANCVWLDYIEKMLNHYEDAGEKAIKDINEHVKDESIKAYLLQELRMRRKAKKNRD